MELGDIMRYWKKHLKINKTQITCITLQIIYLKKKSDLHLFFPKVMHKKVDEKLSRK